MWEYKDKVSTIGIGWARACTLLAKLCKRKSEQSQSIEIASYMLWWNNSTLVAAVVVPAIVMLSKSGISGKNIKEKARNSPAHSEWLYCFMQWITCNSICSVVIV